VAADPHQDQGHIQLGVHAAFSGTLPVYGRSMSSKEACASCCALSGESGAPWLAAARAACRAMRPNSSARSISRTPGLASSA
jgi:hypothetical protein